MASMSELADVETSLRSGAPEVQIRYDRDQLARYGLNIAAVAEEVRDVRRVMPLAIVSTLAVTALLYVLVSAVAVVGTPAPDDDVPWLPDEHRGLIHSLRANPSSAVTTLTPALVSAPMSSVVSSTQTPVSRTRYSIVSSTGCLKVCDRGPAMVVHPENLWYGNVENEEAIDTILDAIEDGALLDPVILADPVEAVWSVSHDRTLRQIYQTSGGLRMTALDVQWWYFEKVAHHARSTGIDPIFGRVLDEWERILVDLGRVADAALDRLHVFGMHRAVAGEGLDPAAQPDAEAHGIGRVAHPYLVFQPRRQLHQGNRPVKHQVHAFTECRFVGYRCVHRILPYCRQNLRILRSCLTSG